MAVDLRDDDSLVVTDSTVRNRLQGRLVEVIKWPHLTNRARTELLVLNKLVATGCVTAGEILQWLLQANSHDANQAEQFSGAWLARVNDDRYIIWENIVCTMVGQELRHVEKPSTQESLRTPEEVGRALEALLHNAAGTNTFGQAGDGVWILDALARAGLAELGEFFKTAHPESEEAAYTLGRVWLWDALLRGFIVGILEHPPGTGTAAHLPDHPEVVQHAVTALRSSCSAPSSPGAPLRKPAWAVQDHDGKQTGWYADKLVYRLQTRIHEEAAL